MRGLNLRSFKKVAENETHTTMRNEDNHEIKIQHSGLKPFMKERLKKLPLYQASGSEAPIQEQPDDKPIAINTEQQPQIPQDLVNPNPGSQFGQMETKEEAPYGALSGPTAMSQDMAKQQAGQEVLRDVAAASQAPMGQAAQQAQEDTGAQFPAAKMYEDISEGVKEQRSGIYKQAAADSITAAARVASSKAEVQRQSSLFNDAQDIKQAFLEHSNQAIQEMKNNPIEANHWFQSKSGLGQVMTSIGLVLGGALTGLGRDPNAVTNFLNKQIDRDIDVQVKNMNNRDSVVKAYAQQFNSLQDGVKMASGLGHLMYAATLQQAADKSGDQRAKAIAMQEAGKLTQAAAEKFGPLAFKVAAMKNSGNVKPEDLMMFGIVNPPDQQAFQKDLKDQAESVKFRDDILDSVNKLNSMVLRGAMSPSVAQSALTAKIGELSKQTVGKYTESDAKAITTMAPGMWDFSQATRDAKYRDMNNYLMKGLQHFSFPMLSKYSRYSQYDPLKGSMYDANGVARIQDKPKASYNK